MTAKKSAPKLPESAEKQPKKVMPKISKFGPYSEPALPQGESTIEIIKNTDPRDLGAATADANAELTSMLQDDTVEVEVKKTAPPVVNEIDDLDSDDVSVISDELTEPLPDDEPGVEPEEMAEVEVVENAPAEPEPSEESDIAVDDDGLPDDEVTNRAVDEIVAEEGDMVLAAEDREREVESDDHNIVKKPHGKFAAFFLNKKVRWLGLTLIAISLLTVALIPESRYFVLNSAQIRSSMSVRVIDNSTLQPLKNVSVRAGGASAATDSDGTAKLSGVRLGTTTLVIEKRAFATIERDITVGWGSNPMGEFKAQAVGSQYTIYVQDLLSGTPIARAEASSGEGNASSDEDGKLVLTLDTAGLEDSAQINVDISADGYRSEELSITANNKESQSVQMVSSRKHSFISKRSGSYDVYTVDIDGKNEQKIVSGTGLERDDIALIPHQQEAVAALVSTRERVVNTSGYLLSTLYLVDTDDGELVKIDQSEKIQIVGWSSEGHLVYVKIAAGASAIDPNRHRLMSFNAKDFADVKELASSNAFNDVVMAKDKIFYAPSNVFQENASPATYAIDPTGTNKQTLLDREAFVLQRTSYNTIDISAGDQWFTYKLGETGMAGISGAPSSKTSRLYADNYSNDYSLWVDERDGRGVLLAYDRKSTTDKELANQSGLKSPMYWLDDKVAVYRVKGARETADYAVSLDGGEPRKISDVTDTAGIERWFYY